MIDLQQSNSKFYSRQHEMSLMGSGERSTFEIIGVQLSQSVSIYGRSLNRLPFNTGIRAVSEVNQVIRKGSISIRGGSLN